MVTGYGKYMPVSEGQELRIAINDLPIDEFNDCASSGGRDAQNAAGDLVRFVPDADGFAWYEAYSNEMTMFGEASIIGKSLVVYADNASSGASASEATVLTDNNVVEEKIQHMTNSAAEDYVSRMGKPIACCTIKPSNYF